MVTLSDVFQNDNCCWEQEGPNRGLSAVGGLAFQLWVLYLADIWLFQDLWAFSSPPVAAEAQRTLPL